MRTRKAMPQMFGRRMCEIFGIDEKEMARAFRAFKSDKKQDKKGVVAVC